MSEPQQPSPPSTAGAMTTLVVGEALIDAVERAGRPAQEHVGGSPANVAFGLAALGHDVCLATWIGDDDRGRRIADRCREVGSELLEGSDGADRTSVARAVLDDSGAASYDFDITWRLPRIPGLQRFAHVHTGSIAAVLEPGGSQVVDVVRRARPTATVSYDPNVRPSLMGSPDDVRARVETLVGLADVVKASDEDLAWLYPDRYIPDVLRHWGGLGASLTVVTRGSKGALYALHQAGSVGTCEVRATEVADTVGAGDSFMAGLLSGLLDAGLLGGRDARTELAAATLNDVRPAIERAVTTGGLTVGRAGAYAPLRSEITNAPA